jgi:DNA-binding Lrp family transcriptional regulator
VDLRRTIDETDRVILNLIQEEFPLVPRPFEQIGRTVGIAEGEALERVKRLKEGGLIRRIGPVLERKRLGYVSALCGVHVPGNRIAEVAAEINSQTGVTHNYERDGELNMWFTITKKTSGEIASILSDIEERFSLTIYRFPEKRTFKIKTFFPL